MAPGPRERLGRGVVFALAGVFLFICADALIKWLSDDYHTLTIVWFSGAFGGLSATALGIRGVGRRALATRRPGAQITRGILILGSMGTAFLALKFLPLADLTAILYSTPLFVAALAVPVLGERLGPRQALALLVGFAGVVLIARPGAEVFHPASLLAVASSFLYAVAMLVTRRMREVETPAATMLYTHATVVAASSLALPWVWITPPWDDALLLVGMGLGNGVAHFCVMQAFRLAPAAVVAPFDYTALVWATLFGLAIWGDFPAPIVWVGVVLVVSSSLYLARIRPARP
ncbi:MAG: DMT family transporter [Alphaproteobacteria bacterium]